jgi:hypothetical protein
VTSSVGVEGLVADRVDLAGVVRPEESAADQVVLVDLAAGPEAVAVAGGSEWPGLGAVPATVVVG